MNRVDVSDPTRIFTGDEWNSLGWKSGWDYVAHAPERMNGREHGG